MTFIVSLCHGDIHDVTPDVVHDLVLALSRHVGIGKDHLHVLPAGVVVQTVLRKRREGGGGKEGEEKDKGGRREEKEIKGGRRNKDGRK